MTDIRVPTLGESVTEATVGKWFKQPGDAVAVDEPLVELETDKVTLEVPAPAAGILGDIAAKDGETVGVGAILGVIKDGAGAAAKSGTATGSAQGRPDVKQATTAPINAAEEEPQLKKPAAAANTTQPPSVKKLAAEMRRRSGQGRRLRQEQSGHQRRHAGGDRARRRCAHTGLRAGADARAVTSR